MITHLTKDTENTSYIPAQPGPIPFSPVTQIESIAKLPSITFIILKKAQTDRFLKLGHANQQIQEGLSAIPDIGAYRLSQQNPINRTQQIAMIQEERQNKDSLRMTSKFLSNLQRNQTKLYRLLTFSLKEQTQVLLAKMS